MWRSICGIKLQRNCTSAAARWLRHSEASTAAAGTDTMELIERKKAMRKVLRTSLQELSKQQMQTESKSIAEQVLQTDFFTKAKRIGIYLHCAKLREVDTQALVEATLQDRAAKRCYVPLVEDKQSNMKMLHLDSMAGLRPAPPFNILEPFETYEDGSPREDVMTMPHPLDLLLMPGLGFDCRGHRLGRGGGYYDNLVNRYLQRCQDNQWPPPTLAALAFQVQVVENVPVGDLDRNVDYVITADSVIECRL